MQTQHANHRFVGQLFLLVVVMFGFGYLMVPLYDVFCDITGINGKTGQWDNHTAQATATDTSRTITVEFIANVNPKLPWAFKPLTRKLQVHPGELTRVDYYAENKTQHDIVGQAVPSVAPGTAAAYFNKTECFCFTQQTLVAGESKSMPVYFIIDPQISPTVHTITLSYTFFKAV